MTPPHQGVSFTTKYMVDRIGVLMALEKLDDLMGRAGSNPASTACTDPNTPSDMELREISPAFEVGATGSNPVVSKRICVGRFGKLNGQGTVLAC